MKTSFPRFLKYATGTAAIVGLVGYIAFQKLTSPPTPVNPVIACSAPTVTLMDFTAPIDLASLPNGWWHQKLSF